MLWYYSRLFISSLCEFKTSRIREQVTLKLQFSKRMASCDAFFRGVPILIFLYACPHNHIHPRLSPLLRKSQYGLLNWVLVMRSLEFNPKTPGLFGPSDTRGGAAAAHFRERRLELPNFHFCPQTVFHMKAGIFS